MRRGVCSFAACSILYQRGVYPSDSFKQKKEYGINLWVSSDDSLTTYLQTVLGQVKGKVVRRFTLIVGSMPAASVKGVLSV